MKALLLLLAASMPGFGASSGLDLVCAVTDFSKLEAVLTRDYVAHLKSAGRRGARSARRLNGAPPMRLRIAAPKAKTAQIVTAKIVVSPSAFMACCEGHQIAINHDYLHAQGWNEQVLLEDAEQRRRFIERSAPSVIHELVHMADYDFFMHRDADKTPRWEEELLAEYETSFFIMDRASRMPRTLDVLENDPRIPRVLRLERLIEEKTAELAALEARKPWSDQDYARMKTLSDWISSFSRANNELWASVQSGMDPTGTTMLHVGLLGRSQKAFEDSVRSRYREIPSIQELPAGDARRRLFEKLLEESRLEAQVRRVTDEKLFARFRY